MANGTIAFDTLTTSDSVNTGTEKSIDTSYIFNGVVKCWVNFDGSATNAASRDSFNVSSMADRGTGLSTITLSNAMSDSNYAGTTSCMGTNGDDDGRNYVAVAMPKDSDEVYVNQFTVSASAADGGYVAAHITGDLA
jgi:hypothetical protein